MRSNLQSAQHEMRQRSERMYRVKSDHHWRANSEDARLMAALQKKSGSSKNDILRRALRVLAEKEGIL